MGRLHFRHNINAHLDSKIEQLIDEHGSSGIGYWWTLVEMYCAKLLEDEKKNPYQKITPRALSRRLKSKVDKAELTMNTMIKVGLILVSKTDENQKKSESLLVDNVRIVGRKLSDNCFVCIPKASKYFGSYNKKENSFLHIKLNEIKEKNNIKKDFSESDQSTFLANRIIESLSKFTHTITDAQSRREFLGEDGLAVCNQLGGWNSLAFSASDTIDFKHSKIKKACKEYFKTRGADRENS